MNCSYKGVFENTISSAGYDNNYGFDGPYSNAYSLNSRVGRLTAGILPDLYKPEIEGPSTVSGIHASYDRLFYNNGNYDGQYTAGLTARSQPIAEANAELQQVPVESQSELPPPSDAPEPTDLTPGERAVITQQAVADETNGTVAVDVEPNPPETIKEQEAFIFGGSRRGNRVLNKQLPITNGQYVAPTRRTNPNRERFTDYTHNELKGLVDSQYLHEPFLDTKQEQDKSNAISLVIVTICLFVITIIILWNTFGKCKCGACDRDDYNIIQPEQKPEQTESLQGGSKLSGSIF